MNIAIIGTGNIGSGLARVLAATSHRIVVTDSKGGGELAEQLKQDGLAVQSAALEDAVANADAVILAVPYGAVADIAGRADFADKIVVDVTNPIVADFSGLQLGFDSSAAEEIAALLPAAKVVKAFNTVFAQIYPRGLDFAGTPVQTFVASDDADAKAAVIGFAGDAGFDARDAGPLKNARYLEPFGFLNIQFGYALGQGTQIAPVWLAR